jgi:hypothetical protein
MAQRLPSCGEGGAGIKTSSRLFLTLLFIHSQHLLILSKGIRNIAMSEQKALPTKHGRTL